jgi:hypothetical protein
MAAILRVMLPSVGTVTEAESLKMIALFCGVGLFVSLLFATYGIDMGQSPF